METEGETVTYDIDPPSTRKPREHWTRILHRIAERAAADPVIRAVHVFGSYSRGALTCGDLDLLVDTTGAEVALQASVIERGLSEPSLDAKIKWHEHHDVTTVSRRKLTQGMAHVTVPFFFNSTLPSEWGCTPVLVWSREHPDVDANLAKIMPDPSAGRFHRDHFVAVSRTGNDLTWMESVMRRLHDGTLTLQVIPFPAQVWWRKEDHPQPWREPGKETARLWPVACDWLRQRGQEPWPECSCQLAPRMGNPKYLVHLGRIDLDLMLRHLERRPDGEVCLIPHLEKGTRPEMYVFTRGAHS